MPLMLESTTLLNYNTIDLIIGVGTVYLTLTIDEIKELVAPVAARYDIEAIYLFGSYARGEAEANSDIDLRVEASRIKSLMTFGGLYSDLEEALANKPDLLTTKNLDDGLLEELEKDEVLIYVPRGKYLRPMLRIKGDSLSTVPR